MTFPKGCVIFDIDVKQIRENKMTKTQYRMETKYETIEGTQLSSSKWYNSIEEIKQSKSYSEDCKIISRETEIITPEFIRSQIKAKFNQ